MAESLPAFVARRRPDWNALEDLLRRQQRGAVTLEELERLDLLYRAASRDLAHAQAHFPGSDATRFLNQLCASAYGAIYRPPKERWKALRKFYAQDLPRTARAHLRYIAASAFVFLLGALAGGLVVFWEPRGADLLVPEGIRDAVAQHRMWTEDVFSVTPPGMASSWIATNNLTVTFTAFALGLLFGVGTLFVLFNNGLHIGSVVALCAREGMTADLFRFITAHGPVELSTIVIAGAAGLLLGHALVDPGELPRAQALRVRGREAVKLVLGIAPFLGAIALVEGFISPSDLALPVKAVVGLGLFAVLWSYLALAGRSGVAARDGDGSALRAARS